MPWRGWRSYCLGPSYRLLAFKAPLGDQHCSRPRETTREQLYSNPFPSLPSFTGRPSPAPQELTGSVTDLQSFTLCFPLGLAWVQGALGSQRPTHGEWMGEELKVLSQLPCSQDNVTDALVHTLFLKWVVRSPRFAPWHAISHVLGSLCLRISDFHGTTTCQLICTQPHDILGTGLK